MININHLFHRCMMLSMLSAVLLFLAPQYGLMATEVTSTVPSDIFASNVSVTGNITATFDQAMNPASITSENFQLRNTSDNRLVSAIVTYDAQLQKAILDPIGYLSPNTFYRATIKRVNGPTDLDGNTLSADKVWSFSTGGAPPPPPEQGTGGPVLIVTTSLDPTSSYYAEILLSEGMNAFRTRDISQVNAAYLADYDVVILASMSIFPAQATMFAEWVDAGGNLIAINPDTDLADLLGIEATVGSTSEGYIKVDNLLAPGIGIVGETMQFHGTSNHWILGSKADEGIFGTETRQVAGLYFNATTSTGRPAVTLAKVGLNGGQAAAFTYDLAKSIVYTRQGNPLWSGQKRDGQSGPIRPNDLFYPNWIDFNKIAIPQADEQQRLLTNLIGLMNLDKKTLPKFWYFPRDLKAVIIMTGDDHGIGGTWNRFDQQLAQSPSGCSVANWQCIRSTSYVYNFGPFNGLERIGPKDYSNAGFEIAAHPGSECKNYTQSELDADFRQVISDFLVAPLYSDLPAPKTSRTHCVAWPSWSMVSEVSAANGIRMDLNYSYGPASWIQSPPGRPGMFTGSGMPQRFTNLDGKLIDVYQVATQMPDDSGISYPDFVDALLNNAGGSNGYYGAFAANMLTDYPQFPIYDPITTLFENPDWISIVELAKSRQIPVISSLQLLAWLNGRNSSSFGNLQWDGNNLTFDVTVGSFVINGQTLASGLRAMLPTQSPSGALAGITKNGVAIALINKTVKGVEYAFFDGVAGSYIATYGVDSTPPVITGVIASTPTSDGKVTITWKTNEYSRSQVSYGLDANALTLNVNSADLVKNHSITLTGLAPKSTYYFRVKSTDQAGNFAVFPDGGPALSFITPIGSQIITFTTPTPVGALVGGSALVSATSTSGLTVSLAIDPSSFTFCSIAAGIVRYDRAGPCKINANQAGNVNYTPALQAQQSFIISLVPQTISFTSPLPMEAIVGGSYSPSATASSGLTVTFSLDAASTGCAFSAASVVSYVGAGICVVNANQGGNSTFGPAPQIQQSFRIKRAPTFNQNLLNRTDVEGAQISLLSAATDLDGDPLTYSATNLPTGLVIDPNSGLISGTISFTAAAASPYQVEVKVSDGVAQAVDTFIWTINNTNRVPSFNQNLPNRTDAENEVISLPAPATDPDGEALTYSATNLPAGLVIDPNSGLISGTISFSAAATSPYQVQVKVSDGVAQTVNNFTWTITNTNRAPRFEQNLPNRTDVEGAFIGLSSTATDSDGDALAYSATGLPTGLIINPATGLISGIVSFAAASASPYAVEVRVSDGVTQAIDAFTWTISNTNRIPTFTQNLQNRTSIEGALINLASPASDLDGDTLVYSATGLPAGLSINSSSGLISGIVAFSAAIASPYNVGINVSDGLSQAVDNFLWEISKTNRAPTFNQNLQGRIDSEGDAINIASPATDLDGDTIGYSAIGLPTGLSINPSSGQITGTISYGSAGSYNVTLRATAGLAQAIDTFIWGINEKIPVPVFTANIPAQTIVAGATVNLSVVANDPAGLVLSYSATGLPPNLVINSASGIITGTVSVTATSGNYTVYVTASNGTGSATQTFIMTVSGAQTSGGCEQTTGGASRDWLTLSLLICLTGLGMRLIRRRRGAQIS